MSNHRTYFDLKLTSEGNEIETKLVLHIHFIISIKFHQCTMNYYWGKSLYFETHIPGAVVLLKIRSKLIADHFKKG